VRRTNGTLLVVEDDVDVTRVIMRVIRGALPTAAMSSVWEARDWLSGKRALCGAVLDLGLPDGSGLDVAEELRRADAGLPIAILTSSLDPALINSVQLLHATYICKPAFTGAMQSFLRFAIACEWVSDANVARALAYVGERSGLSLRETQVVAMAATSLPRREVAETLGVSENTVKTQVRSTLDKTGQATLAELVWEVHNVAEGR